MIDDKRVLAIVPARGGSKGLPRKNVRLLAGKPLIAWTIECALASSYLDRVVLSSDDPEIMSVAASFGCEVPFRRPEALARDDTPSLAVVGHVLEQIPDGELIVLLQPTSPLRLPRDIDACVEAVGRGGAPGCVSVVPVQHPPEYMYTLAAHAQLVPALPGRELPARRQDLPAYVALNGAVYVTTRAALAEHQKLVVPGAAGYVMPAERSIDIDAESDLLYAEWLLKARDAAGAR